MSAGGIPAPNAAEADELQLLRAVRQGDAAAFQRLYARHCGGLYRFALMHSGRAEVAADVVQEVFMGLLGDGYGFDPLRGMLANFLYGVARKLLLRHAGQARRWVQPLHDQADADEGGALDELPDSASARPLARLLDNEAAERLRLALARLAPHYRDVLILYELQELSYQEIAAICQLDLGTVRSRLSRARSALHHTLASYRALTSESVHHG